MSAASCPQCGAELKCERAGEGATMRYRGVDVPVPAQVVVPTCGRCRCAFLDDATRRQLEPILRAGYQQVLRERVRVAIDALMGHISQRSLERLLGLSQGYLSRLRSGAGNPSPELVSHLALIANDPPGRLGELQRFWGVV